MTEKEFRQWLKESFDKIAEGFPGVIIDYGLDFNSKKSRWELTYFVFNEEKEGWGAAYVKKEQLESEKYIADMKKTFVENMKASVLKHFNLYPLVALS